MSKASLFCSGRENVRGINLCGIVYMVLDVVDLIICETAYRGNTLT